MTNRGIIKIRVALCQHSESSRQLWALAVVVIMPFGTSVSFVGDLDGVLALVPIQLSTNAYTGGASGLPATRSQRLELGSEVHQPGQSWLCRHF